MSEKPSGIAHHAFIHHLACISLSLSTAVDATSDATPQAIVAIIVPATTMLTMSHLYPCKQAYKGMHSVISCDKCLTLIKL